jgi:hypothetical protein
VNVQQKQQQKHVRVACVPHTPRGDSGRVEADRRSAPSGRPSLPPGCLRRTAPPARGPRALPSPFPPSPAMSQHSQHEPHQRRGRQSRVPTRSANRTSWMPPHPWLVTPQTHAVTRSARPKIFAQHHSVTSVDHVGALQWFRAFRGRGQRQWALQNECKACFLLAAKAVHMPNGRSGGRALSSPKHACVGHRHTCRPCYS